MARRPLLPTGVAETSEGAGLGGEAALSSDGIGEMSELSGISSGNVFRKRVKTHVQELCIWVIPRSLPSELLVSRFKN